MKNSKNHLHFSLSVMLIVLLVVFLIAIPACNKKKENPKAFPQTTKDLPEIPLYTTGKVIERQYAPDGSFQIRMLTPATEDEVLRWYQNKLIRLGWRSVADYKQKEHLVIYKKHDSLIHISIFKTDNENEILHVLNYKE